MGFTGLPGSPESYPVVIAAWSPESSTALATEDDHIWLDLVAVTVAISFMLLLAQSAAHERTTMRLGELGDRDGPAPQ
jgi:hypothetical protein